MKYNPKQIAVYFLFLGNLLWWAIILLSRKIDVYFSLNAESAMLIRNAIAMIATAFNIAVAFWLVRSIYRNRTLYTQRAHLASWAYLVISIIIVPLAGMASPVSAMLNFLVFSIHPVNW